GRAGVFVLGDELKIVRMHVEKAVGARVLERDRHPALAGRQAMIAHRDVAVVAAERAEVSSGAPSGPDGDELIAGPIVSRVEVASRGDDLLELTGPTAASAKGEAQAVADRLGDGECRGECAIV